MKKRLTNAAITIDKWGIVYFNKHFVDENNIEAGMKFKAVESDGELFLITKHSKMTTVVKSDRGLYMNGSKKNTQGTYMMDGFYGEKLMEKK